MLLGLRRRLLAVKIDGNSGEEFLGESRFWLRRAAAILPRK
jgi:hypothetical protein